MIVQPKRGTRLLVCDGRLREDDAGQLGVYRCDECGTLNAGYGTCPYCSDAAACVIVRTDEGALLTMERALADSFGVATVQLDACQCCNELPRDPHSARICLPEDDTSKRQILSERHNGHSHTH